MDQFAKFSLEKEIAISALNDLGSILNDLGDIEVDVKADVEKIASAVNSINDEELKIALLGAYSDGKTSVIAGWLGQVMADMKIDMDESSDRLAIYRPDGLPEKCQIIDTPGLFGDKEKSEGNAQVMYEDLTKRYISEAHLIVYVVDATNPLKDSHAEIVRWVLRDLNKLDSVVFVINKMDEVTDLTEESLFNEQANIKKKNLIGKLERMAGLSDADVEKLNIVCMAAEPNGRGLDFWFSRADDYLRRSRVGSLKEVTRDILGETLPGTLVAKTGMDVAADLVRTRISQVQEQLDSLEVFAEQREQESDRLHEDISNARREVRKLALELFNELNSMENQLSSKLRSCSLEDLRPFLDEEMGYTEDGIGHKLYTRIKLVVGSYFDQSSAVTEGLAKKISAQLDSSQTFFDSLDPGALNYVSGALKGLGKVNPDVIKAGIFAARDMVAKVGGYVYKFKPWQASKLAAGIAKWAGPAGAAFQLGADIYRLYKASELEKELANVKGEISPIIANAFKDIYDILSDDEKTLDFLAPQLKQFEIVVTDLDEQAKAIRDNQKAIVLIKGKLDALELPKIEK